MEVIILAGGLGTRLREVVKDLPKPMAPVSGSPFIYYIFKWLKNYDVTRVIVSAGYKSSSLLEYLGQSFMNIPVNYAIEEKPLGTGGAIMFSLMETNEQNVIIVNGDTYFPVDLDGLFRTHCQDHNKITVALSRMTDFSRYGSVECVDNSIVKFNEKKFCREGLINGGIYVIDKSFLESKSLPGSFSFEKEVLEKGTSSELKCMVFDEMFIDIGIPEDFLRASTLLKP